MFIINRNDVCYGQEVMWSEIFSTSLSVSVKTPYLWKENFSASTETGCANSDNLLTDMFELLGKAIIFALFYRDLWDLHETEPPG